MPTIGIGICSRLVSPPAGCRAKPRLTEPILRGRGVEKLPSASSAPGSGSTSPQDSVEAPSARYGDTVEAQSTH
eukprot:8077232-Pyramimonas_sp.AAC.1